MHQVVNHNYPLKTMTSHFGNLYQTVDQQQVLSRDELLTRFSPDLQKYDEMEFCLCRIKVCLLLLLHLFTASLPLCFSPEIEMKWNSTAAGSSSTRCAWTIKRVIVIKSRPLETKTDRQENWMSFLWNRRTTHFFLWFWNPLTWQNPHT